MKNHNCKHVRSIPNRIQLSDFQPSYVHTKNVTLRVAWYLINAVVFLSPFFPSSRLKCVLLRIFGATIGYNVVIKPRVNIKYAWNLSIGNNCWIGEGVWLDSLGKITLFDNVCVS